MESTIRLCCSNINDTLNSICKVHIYACLIVPISTDASATGLVARDDQPRKGREILIALRTLPMNPMIACYRLG